MTYKNFNSNYWDNIAVSMSSHFRDQTIAYYHRYEYINLLKKWGGNIRIKNILVTDLFNDAFRQDEFLSWLSKVNKKVIGIDISGVIVTRARQYNPNLKYYIVCDVRRLPFKIHFFDLIISPSTLDHFSRKDLCKSLIELNSILSRDGTLIVTLHNKHNLFLYFILMKYFKSVPFPIECYSIKEIKELLISNGFRIADSASIVHLLFPRTFLIILTRLKKNKVIYNFVREHIIFLSKMGRLVTKYFTGKFIAVKAHKV